MNSKLFCPHAIEERNVFKLLFCVLGSYVVTCNQVFSFRSFRSVIMTVFIFCFQDALAKVK